MNIVIDGRMIGWTGIGRYTKSLLEQLEVLDSDNTYHILMQPQDRHRWHPTQPNFQIVETPIQPYSLGEQIRLSRLLRSLRPDLVHFLSFNSPIFYGGKRITTVHDLTLLHYKNRRGGLANALLYEIKYAAMRLTFWTAMRRSAFVISDAEFTRTELLRGRYINAGHSQAIHLGAPALPKHTKTSSPYPHPYLLYVGNLYPYKNLSAVIAALPHILTQTPDLRLIIVGSQDSFGSRLTAQATRLGVADHVILTGFVSDDELAALYQHASLYVFPSLSEGFGLPPLEAMSYGTPVAAAHASCIPEVLGDAAVYFDPYNPQDIAAVINTLLADSRAQSTLTAAGKKRLAHFSWKRMAEQTLAIYRRGAR